jgi:hypothetical protein
VGATQVNGGDGPEVDSTALASDQMRSVFRSRRGTAAVVMSAVAAVLPPIAAILANWHEDS